MQTDTKIELQTISTQRSSKDVKADPYLDEFHPNYKSITERANIISYLNFFFMFNTVRTSKRLTNMGKTIDPGSLPGLPWKERPDFLEEEYMKFINNRKIQKPKEKPSLALALFHTLKWRWLAILILETLCVFSRIFLVWVAKRLLDSLSDPTAPESDGFMWAGILSGVLLFALYADHHFYYKATLLPMHIRSSLISTIYTKITRLSVYSLNKISLGKLVNIVANDVNVFERTGIFFSNLIVGILGLIGGTALLWIFYGPSCLVGVGYVILGFPIQQFIAKATTKPRDKKNEVTDERVKTTNEIIDGIRLLKMYTWELIFRDSICDIRKREIGHLKEVTTFESVSRGIAYSTQAIACFLIWMTYVLTDHELSVSIVFPTFFLIGQLRMHSVFFFAMALNFITETKLLLKRIENILEAPEAGDIKFDEPTDSNNAIEFRNFNAYWTKEENDPDTKNTVKNPNPSMQTESDKANLIAAEVKPTLVDISLNIKKGSLNALIGKVGSGKSSFLLSFTGEMPKTEGNLRYKGTIAYVEQEPTIFAGTLRENVLFGREYEPEFYNKVIKVCNLESDIQLLPNGDLSEIGEKGINLSGGQKARLSLARACYSDADIYLLDDPLSAVDAKVAKSLYHDAICSLLKGKTVILVTHQVHFIKDLENIIVLDHGKVIGNGTYEVLKEQDVDVDKIFSHDVKKSAKPSINTNTEIKPTEAAQKPQEEEEAEAEAEGQEDDEKEKKKLKPDADKGKLFANEDAYGGKVDFKTYMLFIKQMGPIPMILLLFILFLCNELANVAFNRIVGVWSLRGFTRDEGLGIMGGITAFLLAIYIMKNLVLNFMLLRTARAFHDKMLDGVLKSPTMFFDTNPVGRILNRFSNDLGVMDRFLPLAVMDSMEMMFNIVSTVITIAVISPLILIPIAITAIMIVLILNFCYQSIKQTRNYELGSRSPLYSLFSSSLAGIIVIRSYKQSATFIKKFRRFLYNNTKGSIGFWSTSRFFGFCVDLTYNLAAIASIFILAAIKNSNPGLSGISLSYILSIAGNLQYALRQVVQTNVLMASVARIKAYCELPLEAPLSLPQDNECKQKGWPQNGEIDFNKVYMRYRPNTDHVIRDLTLHANPGEKIGCIGRTGAGKSSIIQILFRMIEIDKSTENNVKGDPSYVNIDGVNTQSLGLHMLRNNISIIPQTPFVFTGTVKRNLDPIGQFSDEQLWKVLEDVNLKTHVEKLEKKLYTDMTNASSVFSVGQKQLICLARAILKKTKLLVLDEATANVDLETDNFIQKKIMEKFTDCTIFTIAHRLSTIANYDKVLVLDKGRKVEFDAPYRLLVKEIGDDHISNENGHFASMVLNTGPRASQQILKIAKAKYFAHHSEGL